MLFILLLQFIYWYERGEISQKSGDLLSVQYHCLSDLSSVDLCLGRRGRSGIEQCSATASRRALRPGVRRGRSRRSHYRVVQRQKRSARQDATHAILFNEACAPPRRRMARRMTVGRSKPVCPDESLGAKRLRSLPVTVRNWFC